MATAPPTTTLVVVVVVLLPLAFLLALSWSWSRKRRSRSLDLNLPPGPRQLPVLGNLHQVGALPHRSLMALARRHGPVMLLRLGSVPTVVVSSPEAAREVMKAHDARCCSRPPMPGPRRLTYGYRDVAFAPYGDHVRRMRRLFVLELLSMRRVRASRRAREAQVDKLVDSLAAHAGRPVSLDDHIFGAVDGIIGTVVFGKAYGSGQFKNQFLGLLGEAMDVLGSFSAEDFFPNAGGRLVDRLTGLVARRERIFRRLDAFFDAVIDQHLSAGARARRGTDDDSGGSDLLQALIELWMADDQGSDQSDVSFTRDHVKAMLFDTFIGGINTSSITMVWAMSELIRSPGAMTTAQDEIRAVVGGDKQRVHADDIPKLRYLKAVIKETLRMHPPLPLLLPRETIQQVNIAGYDIPAATRILINAWAIGRDPTVWKDPDEFVPERFMGTSSEEETVDFHGAHFELTPFGSGRRMCPGLDLAVANMEYTQANLLCCFDWELPEGVSREDVAMDEAGTLAFQKKTPLPLVPVVRRRA